MDWDLFNSIYPIASMDIYKQGAIIKRKCLMQSPQVRTGKRGKIKMLSRRSLDRLAFVAQNTSTEFRSMLTLTYPSAYPRDGKVSKRQLRELINVLLYYWPDIDYLWFLEFQEKRGAPHYHILLSIFKPRLYYRVDVARSWADLVTRDDVEREKVIKVHSHPRAWEDIRSQGGAQKYVTKYATKTRQKEVPEVYSDVGRFWGHSKNVAPKPIISGVTVDNDTAMEFVRSRAKRAENWEVVPKHVWFDGQLPTNSGQLADKPIDNLG